MNKLYKYLPFNIDCVWGSNNDKYYQKDSVYSLTEIMFDSNLHDFEEFVDYLQDNKVKPILRPFEDLIAKLPLTKAAAKMISMKEGEVLNSLEMMFRYNNKLVGFEFQNVNAVKVKDGFVIDLNTETNYVKIEIDVELDSNFNLGINSYAYQKKENHRIANCYYTINSNCLDFLRAMHFNLDFEEGEYIKLKN